MEFDKEEFKDLLSILFNPKEVKEHFLMDDNLLELFLSYFCIVTHLLLFYTILFPIVIIAALGKSIKI